MLDCLSRSVDLSRSTGGVKLSISALLVVVFELCCHQSLKLGSCLSFDPEQFLNLSQKLHLCTVIFVI